MNKAVTTLLAIACLALAASQTSAPVAASSYIIEGTSLAAVTSAVLAVDGEITHELGVIDAVAADLTPEQLARLRIVDGLRVSANAAVETAGRPGSKDPGGDPGSTAAGPVALTDATRLHQEGITGWGVGIVTDDGSGHGTHVQSILLSSMTEADGTYHGIAPYAHLVSVKAFDASGYGTYADVIRGIDWVINNSDYWKLRVINLSLGATPQSHYRDDPLNRAVMRAWEAGGSWLPRPATPGRTRCRLVCRATYPTSSRSAQCPTTTHPAPAMTTCSPRSRPPAGLSKASSSLKSLRRAVMFSA